MNDGNTDGANRWLGWLRRKKFAGDFIWIGGSQVLSAVLGFVTLPALTKNYSAEIYGIWAQTNLIISFFSPIFGFCLDSAVIRFLSGEKDKTKILKSFSCVLWFTIITGLFIQITAWLLSNRLSELLFGSGDHLTPARLCVLGSLFGTLVVLFGSYFQAMGRIKTLAIIQLIFFTFRTIVVLFLTIIGASLEWLIGSLVIVEALCAAGMLGLIVKEIGFLKLDFFRIKSFLAFSIPQIPNSFLAWILGASDRYFIAYFLSLAYTGIYSSSGVLANAVALFSSPIIIIIFPVITRLWEEKQVLSVRQYLQYSTKVFLLLAVPAAFGLYVLSQPILALLTTSEFIVKGELVLLLALGAVFLGIYQLNIHVILLLQRTKWMPLFMASAAIINVSVNVLLIPRIGIIGAGVSNILSSLFLASIGILWAKKAIGYSIDVIFLSKIIAATLIMVICLKFINVTNLFTIISATIIGVVVFALALFLLKAFSKEEGRFFRQILQDIVHMS